MKCPHCDKESRAPIRETRRHAGAVFRRRTCSCCLKTFVSREEAPPGMKMPNETQSRFRVADRLTDRRQKPDEMLKPSSPRGDGLHLQGIWK